MDNYEWYLSLYPHLSPIRLDIRKIADIDDEGISKQELDYLVNVRDKLKIYIDKINDGYQLMAAIEQVSNGRIKMGPGTLYGILTRLQKDNLIEILSDDGRRKTYAITEDGRIALKSEYTRLRDMIQDGRILEG